MQADPLFTERDLEIAERCLEAPTIFDLTEPEIRACRSVVEHCTKGAAINDDAALLARTLFDAIRRLKETDE
jgi:hypothetical protein